MTLEMFFAKQIHDLNKDKSELLGALTDLFNDIMYLDFSDECEESFQKASRTLSKFQRVGGE
jgi:hypothetical protein